MALNAIKMVFDGSFLTLWCDSKNPNQPTFPEIISLFFTVLLVSTLIATDPLRLPRLRDNERRQRRGEILNKEEEQHKVELVEKYRSEVARRSFPGQYLGSEEAKPKMDRERKQKLGFSEV